MHTDPRPRISIPLAHDHFREGPKKAPGAKRALRTADGEKKPVRVGRRVAETREAALDVLTPEVAAVEAHPATPASVKVAKAALQATKAAGVAAKKTGKAAGVAAKRTGQAARWSWDKSFRFLSDVAHRLKTRPRRPTPEEEAAEHQSRYAALPNRLTALAGLSGDQYVQTRASQPNRRIHQAGSILLAEGEQQPDPLLVLSGWACRSRMHEGKLHVLGLLLPGDGIGLFGPSCTVSSTRITAITTLETADGQMMLDLVQKAESDSALKTAMHRVMAEEEALLLNHIMRMTIKAPVKRLAHFLLELRYRLVRTGLATASEMPLPLDRHTVASVLGLSASVVAKAVRRLEMERIARFGHGRVRILNDDKLQKLGCFTPPAFADGSGRRLINDLDADDTFNLPPTWIDPASIPQPQQHVADQKRPASA